MESQKIRIAVVGGSVVGQADFCQRVDMLSEALFPQYQFLWERFSEPEELVSRSIDVILQLVDSMDLEESMVMTPQLIDMHQKVVVALTGYHRLLATNHSLDYGRMGKLMGVQAVPVGDEECSVEAVLRSLVDAYLGKEHTSRHVHVHYGPDIELAIRLLKGELKQFGFGGVSLRYLSVRLLESPEWALCHLEDEGQRQRLSELAGNLRMRLSHQIGQEPAVAIHEARHGFVHGALEETLHHSDDNSDHTLSDKIDAVLTNRWLGFPILVLVLYLVFECTFTIGSYPQEWIQMGVDHLCGWIKGVVSEGWFSSMLVDGVLKGVGAVLAFLPNIVILFFFISLMEDSGYMSRVAFLMDKIMHKVGLHGRSFVPMLVGFGCNVPAIMAARTIPNHKDRVLTMLMVPFMSCGARLPVYLLLVGAFFEEYKALVMISLYLAGIVFSILFALLMKRTRYFRQDEEDYVSELPPFHKPQFGSTGRHIWERCADYLKKISTVILLASVIIWALEYFPRPDNGADNWQAATKEQQESSYLASIGKMMEPVMRPLGFDWRMNVCILTGLPAKEAIVSTMGILWSADDKVSEGEELSLQTALRNDPDFTPVTAYSFMLFVLLYFPCIATIATLRREIGRGWAMFTVVHSLALAWVAAFLVQLFF